MPSNLNVLVTGAGGFIGKCLVQRLHASGHRVCVLGRNLPKDFLNVERVIEQDITKQFELPGDFDAVFHLAALNITHVGLASRADYDRVNLLGTENVFNGTHTRRFVYMSTAKVYRPQGHPVTEASALAPRNDYEQSKLAAEEFLQKADKESAVTIFRSVNIVGPGQAHKALLPVFFEKAMRNETLQLVAPGNTLLQLLFIEDAVNALRRVLDVSSCSGLFNLAGAENIQLKDLALRVIEITGSRSTVNCPMEDSVLPPSIVDDQLAQQKLGWKPVTKISEILSKSFDAMRNAVA